MKNRIKYSGLFLIIVTGLLMLQCESSDMSQYQPGTSGKGGSMARFTISCNHLFIVDDRDLRVLNLENPKDPVFVKEINVGRGIETIFPYKDKLFIGSNDGMYIYNLSNCSNPEVSFLSRFVHVMACDPVVANDSFAYVTLRSNSDCRTGSTANELNIIDVTDISKPKLIISYPMDEPHGLAIEDYNLFLCHGKFGFSLYNVANPKDIKLLSFYKDIHAFDCILHHNRLLIVGDDGFYQYDYSDLENLVLLSSIKKGE